MRVHRVPSSLALTVLLGTVSIVFTGCGQAGAPLAPSLGLPTPVTDLALSRVADRVTLKWTMPRHTTDKLPLKGAQSVRICRREDDGPCQIVGSSSFPPEKPASYEDNLQAALVAGTPRLLVYSIEVMGPHGHSVGASNLAYTASGAAPPGFVAPRGEASANGVVLRWQPGLVPETAAKIGIERTLLSNVAPSAKQSKREPKSPFGGGSTALAKEQTLVVRLPNGADPGKALDPDAAFDQRYTYRIFRVNTIELAGKSIEVDGPVSPEIVVDTKDIFPPAPPSGLAAVAASGEKAIDLSWIPGVETDLAGYAVYRSEKSGLPQRISPAAKPLDGPAFRDLTAQPGQQYSYSVTAIDRDGNESGRSAEVTESLPLQP